MEKTSILFGTLLIILGVGSYVATGMVSVTALIPAFFGIPIALCGALAMKPSLKMHAMHGAAVLKLLGLLGSASGIFKVAKLLLGGSLERPNAAYAQAIMAVLMLVFMVLMVRSFIAAKKARLAAEAESA